MISGLSDDTFHFVTEVSMERYVENFDPKFIKEIMETDSYGDILTEDQEKYS